LLPKVILPVVGRRIPAAMFSKVVFPQPEGPSTVKSSPFLSIKFKSFYACTVSPFGVLKIMFRS